ncbi:hypothetical protein EDC04DRAFT_2582861 [Pisolithus marmoratus]|nr:hypothetical protein EDC04DRAFT_2582861 [Pisolithus marmoratus]
MQPGTVPLPPPPASYIPVRWNHDEELADRRREADADSAAVHAAIQPLHVDRRVLRDIVREHVHAQVGRITFLSSGVSTSYHAYLITLVDTRLLIARVARRFMPRLKTESEIATMQYLRDKTSIPVPDVYHYNSNPYNRLGGEYILMSKAAGIPLSQVYYAMSNKELKALFTNLASIILPLFAQRFSHIGSLYFGPSPDVSTSHSSSASSTAVASRSSSPSTLASSVHTPTPTRPVLKGFQFMPLLSRDSPPRAPTASSTQSPNSSLFHTPSASTSSFSSLFPTGNTYHVGPIISWPFFGSNRGFISHPSEMDRGPWPSTSAYLKSSANREINAVIAESNGRSAPHRLHLDPDTIHSSRHHHLLAFPDDPESDESDEWDAQESEDEDDDCVGANMYRDYRRMQRGTFLVAHIKRREGEVRREMGRWVNLMERLGAGFAIRGTEEFGLDCHDLSLENIFVDEKDHTRITCVIDWESTTTRPLWACAHLPAFVESSPFTAKLFREVVAEIATGVDGVDVIPHASNSRVPATSTLHPPHIPNSYSPSNAPPLSTVASSWLHLESWGTRLRYAHRCVEWDGWEEGLVESILGPEDTEKDWFAEGCWCEVARTSTVPPAPTTDLPHRPTTPSAALRVHRRQAGMLILKKEREKEQMLVSAGDICGGRGGELGRRLEEVLQRESK